MLSMTPQTLGHQVVPRREQVGGHGPAVDPKLDLAVDAPGRDGGDFCHFGRAHHPARRPGRWLYIPTLGMLGSSLPAALAAKLAYPQARVVNITGDGAFGFQAMEFDTAVRHGLPIELGRNRGVSVGIAGL